MSGQVHDVRRPLIFVRPRRQVTIRTRLDLGTMRERLAALAAAGEPDGWERFNAHGYFLDGGAVGPSDFILDYRFNNPKNAQVYEVRGVFEETDDWRYVHLDFEAHEPWMGGWEFLGMTGFIAASTALRSLPWGLGVAIFVFCNAFWAWANLISSPRGLAPIRFPARKVALLALPPPISTLVTIA